MTRIGIIDADLLGRDDHRFPNLVCEKLSGFWKERGADVTLLMDYDRLNEYDHVYVSKVFTDTPVPDWLTETDRIHLGGTGFYFDKAPRLSGEVEHHMPDYHLYDAWLGDNTGKPKYKEYTDYSIGFLTRGCFRKCKFCVNHNETHVYAHSPLKEFLDPTRKKICLLDDNFLGYSGWEGLLTELVETGKPFKFKQGLDERLLTDRKCELLFSAKYDGYYTFAFDNVEDYDLIERKLKLIRKYTDKDEIRFYVLCGFTGTGVEDIEGTFRRIALLMKYKCLPYVMRYQSKDDAPWARSAYRSMYVTLARWVNQPSFFKKKSFREYCHFDQTFWKTEGLLCPAMKTLRQFEQEYPAISNQYFDLKFAA